MNFSAIMFDLDGTLLDTLEDLADSANRTLRRYGFPAHDLSAYRYFISDGALMLVRRMLPETHRDDKTVSDVLVAYREDYQANWDVKTRPYEGVPEMLDELVERGLRFAVLSNKPDAAAQLCVSRLLSRWSFEVILGHKDGSAPKPDPTAARCIAERMRLAPAQFLYLGDAEADMQTAVAAGMFPLGALWGFRTRAELEGAGARAVIQHPRDVLKFID